MKYVVLIVGLVVAIPACTRDHSVEDPLGPIRLQLVSDQAYERKAAAEWLKGLESIPESAMPDLLAALADPDPQIRLLIAEAMLNLEPAAAGQIESVQRAISSEEDPEVQKALEAVWIKMGDTLDGKKPS